MKKRFFAILLALVLCLCCAVPALAANIERSRVSDGAELLDDDEVAQLTSKLDEMSTRLQMDIVVMTSDDLQGYDTATECADELYEYCGYGFGDDKDGIMLFISMDDRDWAISTCGKAIDVFTDDDCDYIADEIVPYLSDGDYYEAFDYFADLCDDLCTQYDENGGDDDGNWSDDPIYDDDYFDDDYDDYRDFTLPSEKLSPVWILISIVVGVLLSAMIVSTMVSNLKSVRFQPSASSYVKPGTMSVSDSSDLFLYSTMTRTPRPKHDDNSSSGSMHMGGSTVHMSSSGTMHGGTSGKF